MPKHNQRSLTQEQQKTSIERPLTRSFAPYVLMGERLMMMSLIPDHRHKLYAEIFSQSQVMKYCGEGKAFTFDEYTAVHLDYAKKNLTPSYDQCGHLSEFTWTIVTHEGIAGQLNIHPSEGRTELAFRISPTQQGKALARRASELVVAYIGEETPYITTAHPLNKASSKTLEQICYPHGERVFFRDPKRQNVPNVYGKNQPRDYFLSQKENKFSFFSFSRGLVHIDTSEKLQQDDYSHVT